MTVNEELDYSVINGRIELDPLKYPSLSKYATFMPPPNRPVVGREHEMRRLLASLNRAELSNAFLLGDAGSGKTMLVQGTAVVDTERIYVEVDLAKMAASERDGEDGTVQMATRLKSLFDEAEIYKRDTKKAQLTDDSITANELVMFIDEFHLLIQLSNAAAQAIKPVLAESGRRGIKVIAATTFAEFHEHVEQDQALMQRLQRINIREPAKHVTLSILESIAEAHGVADFIYDDQLFELIYEYSNRYIPADSQPRKSILMLDAMIGWYRTFRDEYEMDRHLLADVILDTSGIQVSFEIDGRQVERNLNNRVFSQEFATSQIERRLQIAVADLHDKSRPISSFLFSGPTGTGKTEMVKGMAQELFGDEKNMIRFDMSEYAVEDSLDRFRESLTRQVWDNAHSVVLFDEVEKANPVITRLMLQVLDDGRLSNAQGREVSFLNTYIVLTTNAGSEVYESIAHYASSDDGSSGLAEYSKVIRASLINDESFAPEIINRMNAIVPFQPLSSATYISIAKAKLRELRDNVYRVHGAKVQANEDVINYLVYEIFDMETDSGGARGLMAGLDAQVVSPLARYINNHPDEKNLGIIIRGKMRHYNTDMRVSQANVVIGKVSH